MVLGGETSANANHLITRSNSRNPLLTVKKSHAESHLPSLLEFILDLSKDVERSEIVSRVIKSQLSV
jgi:hypothetical protein